jgi:hypothetical protein
MHPWCITTFPNPDRRSMTKDRRSMIEIKDQRSHSPRRIPDGPIMHPRCYHVIPVTGRRSQSATRNKIQDQRIITQSFTKWEHTTFGEIYRDNRYENEAHKMRIYHIWRNLQGQSLREQSSRPDSNKLYSTKSLLASDHQDRDRISIRKVVIRIPWPNTASIRKGFYRKIVQRSISNSWRQRSNRLHDVCRQVVNFTTPGSSHPLKWN